MILFEDDLSVPLPIGQVSFKSYLPNKKLYLSRTTGRDFLVPCLGVTGRHDTRSFRYKFNSFEVSIVSRTWLKERRIFTQTKCFSCSIANFTWSDRNFCAISLLEFVSKRLVSKRLCIFSVRASLPKHFGLTVWHEIFAGSNFCDFSSDPKNKFPQINITANIFPAKIYSRVNIV